MTAGDLEPTACPNCGDTLDRESVDVEVGVICGPWGCYSCGWSSDSRFDRRHGSAPADAEYPLHILLPTGIAYPKWRAIAEDDVEPESDLFSEFAEREGDS